MPKDSFTQDQNFPRSFPPPDLSGLDSINFVKNRRTDKQGRIQAEVIFRNEGVFLPEALIAVQIRKNTPLLDMVNHLAENLETVILAYTDDDDLDRPDHFYPIGLECAIGNPVYGDAENVLFLFQARRRVRLMKLWIGPDDEVIADAEVVKEKSSQAKSTQALQRLAIKAMESWHDLSGTSAPEMLNLMREIKQPGVLADAIATAVDFKDEQRIGLLQETDGLERLRAAYTDLLQENQLLKLENSIQDQVQNELDRTQREAFLREKIAKFQQELDDGHSADPEIRGLREKLAALELPQEVREVADRELRRLESMPPFSPETGMLSSYIRWIIDLPWTEGTTDNLDLKRAREVLDRNHYGLKRAKDRVLEFLAVRSLKPKRDRQPILCFVGPPGTGKTSMGKSIAEVMDRKFIRLSLGGVHDEAEIRGHRRTYIGALPGRILQTMAKAKVVNPLFMLDEIDKLNADFQGDPAAALLEVLDPEQNFSFADHYLEVPYDLSKVFFITTANTITSIPPALLDRMEVIEFPGYIEEEKLTIARQFLIPEQLLENGLDEEQISISDEALKLIIRSYTYEAGVRNFEREIGSVLRKLATRKAEGEEFEHQVDAELVQKLLGPIEFFPMTAEAKDEVGMATAIAWTENGGEIMPIEVLVVNGKGNLQITGQIGEIMQESAQAALSYLKSKQTAFNIPEDFFEDVDIHVHVPEGSIPKDGPSAGITLATALTSAVLCMPVLHDVAMTGEITLRGRVLPIGGVREKVLAANRAGIKTILLPARNEKDLVDVPKQALDQMNIVFVQHMDEVLAQAFEGELTFKRSPRPGSSGKKKGTSRGGDVPADNGK
ncbi:MAG TPA: endopeptidase La [Anaerolineaceae bacterium]|jgi:ATP-dependent Lon protease|nr:endopeptidase La [Chloroflexota bacterium]HNZ16244.1 endopeptidase La [Anaerolineaceae bacterium]